MSGHARSVDDRSASMREHIPSRNRVRKEHTIQVHIDIFLPLGICHLVRRRVDAYACIGVAEVKSAKPIDDFIHHRQQDPILMAAKRNNEMAACDRFDVETWPAFNHWVDDVITTFTSSRAEAVPEYEW